MYNEQELNRHKKSDSLKWILAFSLIAVLLVGMVASPLYLNYERGTTSLGTGSVAGFVYVPQESFDIDYYTDLYLTVPTTGALYTDEYQDEIDAVTDDAAIEDETFVIMG